MSTIRRFAKNVSYLYATNIINRILNLVLFIYIARHLGDTGFGQYSFILAFVGLFAVIHDFGLYVVISRDIAKERNRASDYVSNAILIKIGLVILTSLLIIFSINLLGYPQEIKNLVYIYAVTSFLNSFSAPFRALFIAYERMEYEAAIVLIERLLIVPLSIAVLLLGYGLEGLIKVLLISGFVLFSLSFLIALKKITKLKFEIDLKICKKLIRVALPFVFLGVFNTIYASIDVVMLSKIAGDATTGWYNASYRLLSALLFIPGVFMGALFPVMSRFSGSSKDSLILAFRKSFKFLLILALPLAVGVTLLANRIIIRVYGDVFTNSIAALQILVWGIALMFLNNVLSTTLISINKEKTNAKIVGFGVALNVVLNLLLIPRFLHIGASFATVVVEATFFILAFYSIARSLHCIPIHKLVFKPAVASFIMAAFVLYFREVITLFVIIPLAAFLYFIILFLINGFSDEDFKLFKKLVSGETL